MSLTPSTNIDHAGDDPMDVMDQVDTLIDELTKAQKASEQVTTPGRP